MCLHCKTIIEKFDAGWTCSKCRGCSRGFNCPILCGFCQSWRNYFEGKMTKKRSADLVQDEKTDKNQNEITEETESRQENPTKSKIKDFNNDVDDTETNTNPDSSTDYKVKDLRIRVSKEDQDRAKNVIKLEEMKVKESTPRSVVIRKNSTSLATAKAAPKAGPKSSKEPVEDKCAQDVEESTKKGSEGESSSTENKKRKPKKTQVALIKEALAEIGSDDSKLPLQIVNFPGKNRGVVTTKKLTK